MTIESFLKHLAKSGLLPPEEVQKIERQVPREKWRNNAHDLATELARQKKLTVFQANAIYNGKTQGLILGNYVLLDKIGAGGMGMVFKAEHRRMKRVVAIKVLPRSSQQDPAAFQRFQRELEAAAKLTHPNVVAAFDADECNGTHFLAMEYVDGIDLARYVQKYGPMSPNKALDCIVQAARGLEYAHSQGIIHRDIKPANLLIDKNSVVKVLDMGLARIHESKPSTQYGTGGSTSSFSGDFMGTVDYASPEQALDSASANQASDIYSLGAAWYFLLVGEPMYVRDTATARLMAHRDDPIPSLRDRRSEISPQIDAIFQRMVAKSKESRYATVTELLHDLAPWHTAAGGGAGSRPGTDQSTDGVPQNVISAIFDD